MAEQEQRDTGAADVVLMVCIECGTEHELEDGESPAGLTCEKCGGEVFRRFDDTASPGEAASAFRDATERDLDTDDPAGDATPGDLHDLNNP